MTAKEIYIAVIVAICFYGAMWLTSKVIVFP